MSKANIATRSARARLGPRAAPYFHKVRPKLFLGYRKPKKGPGRWVFRVYFQDKYNTHRLPFVADDKEDMNVDNNILDFDRAVKAVIDLQDIGFTPSIPEPGGYTVKDASADYLRRLRLDGRQHTVDHTHKLLDYYILPELANEQVKNLTTKYLTRWRDGLLPGRKRASVNRIWCCLRSILNMAFHDGHVASDTEWRRLKPLPGAVSARQRYLTVEEANRLLDACTYEGQDFRDLCEAAFLTACRYSELTNIRGQDVDTQNGLLHLPRTKAGRPRDVILTAEAVTLFKRLVVDRNAKVFPGWGPSSQLRPMVRACERANISDFTFHGWRHSWASLAVMNGMPLHIVARALGHRDTKMVIQHYAHLSPSFVADSVRQFAPRLQK
jgi:prepilin-type processing-associated H-X9-DG protein